MSTGKVIDNQRRVIEIRLKSIKGHIDDLEAHTMLMTFIKACKPPEELLPHLKEMEKAWLSKAGNPVSNRATDRRNYSIVWDIHALRVTGMKKGDSIQEVASRYQLSIETVGPMYKGTKYQDAKDEVEMLFSASWRHPVELEPEDT